LAGENEVLGENLPTAVARVRARVWQVGFVVEKEELGRFSSRVFQIPLPIFIPPNFPASQSPGASTISQRRVEWTHFGLGGFVLSLKKTFLYE
jgi:hypothetical protein